MASVTVGAPQQAERRPSRKKLNHSSSFKTKQIHLSSEAFSRENEMRHSTGSIRVHSDKRHSEGRPQALYIDDDDLQPMMRERSNSDASEMENIKRTRNVSKKDVHSSSTTMNDSEDGSLKVSTLIRGFQSQIDGSGQSTRGSYRQETYSSANDISNKSKSLGIDPKRAGSKRKLSLRRRAKTAADESSVTIMERLGISPFMGAANRSAKKSFAYFDIPSILFDLSAMIPLKNLHEEGNNRQKNVSTGASAASIRVQQKKTGQDDQNGEFRSRTQSIIDDGDSKTNRLVESCPYFRNEIGDSQESEKGVLPWVKKSAKLQEELSKGTSGIGKRTRSFEILQVSGDDSELQSMSTYDSSDGKFTSSVMEPVQDDSEFMRWGRSPDDTEERYFEFEHIDYGALYYRQMFIDQEHVNYLGIDEKFGPVAVSLRREPLEKMAVLGHTADFGNNSKGAQKYQHRVILRTAQLYAMRGTVLEDSIPSTSRHGGSRGLPVKDVLEFCFPDLQLAALRLATPGPKVQEQLQKLDEQQLTLQYKVGVLYCRAGQCTEEDMYNNEMGGPAFEEFLDILGDKVVLKGFQGYRAQLDNRSDSTGTHSTYVKFHNREVMFHVTTMLPWTPNNKQQNVDVMSGTILGRNISRHQDGVLLLRKRHIGNDIVTVIFQEPGAVPFTPKNIRSHFQHVFIVVQVDKANTPDVTYRVAVSRSRDVPNFGPAIPPGATFTRNKAFKDFLLTKIINAENAAHKSEKFSAMAVRTRYELLKDLALNNVTTTTVEAAAKFGKFSMSLTSKKKDKTHPPVNPEVWCHGALLWKVRIELEKNTAGMSCYLGISAHVIAVIDIHEKEPLFVILCKAVLGWRLSSSGMKLYYNNGQVIHFYMSNEDHTEMPFIINRLKAVTPGCETHEMTLRRNNAGQLGFHVFYEGLVAEVEPYGMAWQTGLRKGSRLLEVANHVVADMSHDRMIYMLKKPGPVRATILPPTPDGQPRNYKVVRNMKRYSSLTSLYSVAMNNEGESSSAVSSRENLAMNGDSESPVAGSQELSSSSTPSNRYRQQPQSRRPPSYNESMKNRRRDDSSISSADKPASFRNSSRQLLKIKPGGGNLPLSASSYEIGGPQPAPTDNGMSHRAQSQNELSRMPSHRDALQMRPLKTEPEQKAPITPGGIDAELYELERNITNTRKSIDAKFYRSLANSSNDNVNDEGGFDAFYRPVIKEQRSPKDAPLRPTSLRSPGALQGKKDVPRNMSPRKVPNSKAAAVNSISNEIMRRSISEQKSPLSSQPPATIPSPRSIQAPVVETGGNETPMSFENIYCALSSSSEAPSEAPAPIRKVSAHGKQSPSQSRRMIVSESDTIASSIPPQHAIAKGIVRRRSSAESGRKDSSASDHLASDHLHKSTESLQSSSSERMLMDAKAGSIVHSRVRNVTDVLKEKKQSVTASPGTRRRQRVESYDIALSTPIRQPSLDSESEKKLAALFSKDTDESQVAAPSKDESPPTKDESLPYKETTLGSVITTVETFKSLDDSLDDTFAKIDEAFGFRSYGGSTPTPPAFAEAKDEKKKKRKSLRRRSRHTDVTRDSESSDDEVWDSKRRLPTPRRGASPKKPTEMTASNGELIVAADPDRHVPIASRSSTSSASTRRSKSEAEESLEFALNDLKQSLSTMRDQEQQNSSDNKASSAGTPGNAASPITTRRIATQQSQPTTQEQPFRVRKVTTEMRDVPSNRSSVALSSTTADEPPVFGSTAASVTVETRGTPSQPGKRVSACWMERPFSLGESNLNDKGRIRSEAKIMLVSSPRPWVARKSSEVVLRKSSDMNASLHDLTRQGNADIDRPRSASHAHLSRPQNTTSCSQDDLSKPDTIHDMTDKPEEEEFCMKSLPGRGRRRLIAAARQQPGVQIPLEVRGLDLAALSKSNQLHSSSKEDLQVILTMLSEQLQTERREKLDLQEQLVKAEKEREKLLGAHHGEEEGS